MDFAIFDGFSTRGRYPRALDTDVDLYRYGYVGSAEQLAVKFQEAVHFTIPGEVRLADSYLYQAHVRSFVRAFRGSHPAVMAARVGSCPPRLHPDDPRWRCRPTWKERQRLAETWLYERIGVPRFRKTRYSLVGGYVKKERQA